jgi:hypothetical protein
MCKKTYPGGKIPAFAFPATEKTGKIFTFMVVSGK